VKALKFSKAQNIFVESFNGCFRHEGLNDKLHLTPWMRAAPSPYGRRIQPPTITLGSWHYDACDCIGVFHDYNVTVITPTASSRQSGV